MSIHSKGTTKGRHDAEVHVGTPSASYNDYWVKTNVFFHGFADMPEVRGKSVQSPIFFCLGYEWALDLYPRGGAGEGAEVEGEGEQMISVFLKLCSSDSVEVEFGFMMKDFSSKTAGIIDRSGAVSTFVRDQVWGFPGWMKRNKCLSSLFKGALVIEIRMKPAANPPFFIPTNPSTYSVIQDLFNEEEDADVVFEVGYTKFYAHSLILRKAAPQLAELCTSDGSQSPINIQIPDMRCGTFGSMLLYIYGRPIPGFGRISWFTKEIIEAADKFGVTNLKLEAEAYYVASVKITAENVLEHLLFADSVNCALLKEKVMDYILENSFELLSMNALKGAPSDLFTDALAAMARKGGPDKAGSVFISELRRKCYDKGLDFDGSRDMLTSALVGGKCKEAVVEAAQDSTTDHNDDDDGDENDEEEEVEE